MIYPLALLYGLVPPERVAAVKDVLARSFEASPYMEKYILESLFESVVPAGDGTAEGFAVPLPSAVISTEADTNDTWYVWNPGTERTPLCETLSPDEWRRFYCLEPVMKKSLPLAPGKSRTHKFKVTVGK